MMTHRVFHWIFIVNLLRVRYLISVIDNFNIMVKVVSIRIHCSTIEVERGYIRGIIDFVFYYFGRDEDFYRF